MSSKALFILALIVAVMLLVQRQMSSPSAPLMIQHGALNALDIPAGPQQGDSHEPPFIFNGFKVQSLASFTIHARVLSRRDYRSDTEAQLSPLDLALGWGRMADPAVYEQLNIRQSGRWFHYSWSDQPPIPTEEIVQSAANMHMIPVSDAIRQILETAEAGDMIKLKGRLVEVSNEQNWAWRSSLSRSDSGQGACEIVFVESVVLN